MTAARLGFIIGALSVPRRDTGYLRCTDPRPPSPPPPPPLMSPDKANLTEKFAAFNEHWSPKIVAELNGQQVKLSKFKGPFIWHQHEHEDEMFLVHRGSFRMEFRDRTVTLNAGDFLVVPRGVEHRPVADEEVHVVLFEPAGTVNTGNVRDARTIENPARL